MGLLPLGWIRLVAVPVCGGDGPWAGAAGSQDGHIRWDEREGMGGQRPRVGDSGGPLEGLLWLGTGFCHPQAPRGSARNWLSWGPWGAATVGRELPQCILWFCFLGGGDQRFSSHWCSSCQNKTLWFCVVTILCLYYYYYFLKILCF